MTAQIQEPLSGTSAPEAAVQKHHTYPGLNGLRAAGAIMVVATHTGYDTGRIMTGWTGGALARMNIGVAIFFVLSGFLLSRPFFLKAALGREAPDTKHYLWKRALRVLPLYWMVVLLVYFVEPENADLPWTTWLRNATLTQLYTADLPTVGLTQMWSLCTEVAFYLILPFLCAVMIGRTRIFRERRYMLWLVTLSVVGVTWKVSRVKILGRAVESVLKENLNYG